MVYELVSATGNTKPGERDYNGATNFLVGKLQENAHRSHRPHGQILPGPAGAMHAVPQPSVQRLEAKPVLGAERLLSPDHGSRRIARRPRDRNDADCSNQDFGGEGEQDAQRSRALLRAAQRQDAGGLSRCSSTARRSIHSGYVKDVDRRAELAKLIIKSELHGQGHRQPLCGAISWAMASPSRSTTSARTTPPAHPELLERSGQGIPPHSHDLKQLIRWITLSEAYGLSQPASVAKNKKDDPSLGEKPMFSHFYLRQMRAEELYESLLMATEATRRAAATKSRRRHKAEWLDQFTIAFGTDEGRRSHDVQRHDSANADDDERRPDKKAIGTDKGSFLEQCRGRDDSRRVHCIMAALARRPTGRYRGHGH